MTTTAAGVEAPGWADEIEPWRDTPRGRQRYIGRVIRGPYGRAAAAISAVQDASGQVSLMDIVTDDLSGIDLDADGVLEVRAACQRLADTLTSVRATLVRQQYAGAAPAGIGEAMGMVIARRIEQQGTTFAAVAAATGLDQDVIEQGRLTVDELDAIARVLGTSPWIFIEDVELIHP